MATTPRTKQQAPVQPQPQPARDLIHTRAPWEKDETLPEITFEYRQSDRGRWFVDRAVTINSLDPMTEEGTQAIFEVLERIDQIAREHQDYLYQQDAESRAKWLANREQGGNGGWS